MSDLSSLFQKAAAEAPNLAKRPDNETMLKLYALYKQATQGDVTGKRPGMMDMVGRAKFDAWSSQKGLSTDQAKQAYIDLVEALKRK